MKTGVKRVNCHYISTLTLAFATGIIAFAADLPKDDAAFLARSQVFA